MAAFSTLGLIAAGVIAGGAATKLATRKKDDPAAPLAPGPTDANASLAPPAPPIVNPSEANAAGLAAGAKQRKRAAGGSLLTNRIAAPSTMAPAKARISAPRSLLGS